MTPTPSYGSKQKPEMGRVVLCLLTVLILTTGCSFSSVLPFFGPTATLTPTETLTPSITPSSTPTIKPTSTFTNTPIPPRFDMQAQQDGSTLVLDRVCGYQFILPVGWKTIGSGETDTVMANLVRDTDMIIDPSLTLMLKTQPRKYETLELELYGYTAEELKPLDSVLVQEITTNGYGTTTGTLKLKKFVPGMLHTTFTQTYTILFLCGDKLILLEIGEWFDKKGHSLSSSELQSIAVIKNSIQFK